jgi:hypothetical protein
VPGYRSDSRLHDDRIAVGIGTGGVAAEDHRQRVGGQPDAAQRPEVVVVEGGGGHVDHDPPVRYVRLGALADGEGREGFVRIDPFCVGSEHGPHASNAAAGPQCGSSRAPRTGMRSNGSRAV